MNPIRFIIIPAGWLFVVMLALFLDKVIDDNDVGGFFDSISSIESSQAFNTLGDVGKITASILAAIFTVSTLVVQIAVIRFTPLIITSFTQSYAITGVIGFLVTSELFSIWINFSISEQYVPRVIVIVAVIVFTVSFFGLFPYFTHLLDFLDPTKVISSMTKQSVAVLDDSKSNAGGTLVVKQGKLLDLLDRISDIGVKALGSHEKIVGTQVIAALHDVMNEFSLRKAALPEEFWTLPVSRLNGPDFATLTPSAIHRLSANRTWVEWKILRKFQILYFEALRERKEVCYLIGYVTSQLGQTAALNGDVPAVNMSIKFYNTYLRYAINEGDIRTIYNLLLHYRILAETLLVQTHNLDSDDKAPGGSLLESVTNVARHLVYYSQVCHERKLYFVCQIIAFDMCTICEVAFDFKHRHANVLLDLFLDLLSEVGDEGPPSALASVRRAQVKLAVKLLAVGVHLNAVKTILLRIIHDDNDIHYQVFNTFLNATREEFWEINDRGTNFDYLDHLEKKHLAVFYSKFDHLNLVEASNREQRRLKLENMLLSAMPLQQQPSYHTPESRRRAKKIKELKQAVGRERKIRSETIIGVHDTLRTQHDPTTNTEVTIDEGEGTQWYTVAYVPAILLVLFGLTFLSDQAPSELFEAMGDPTLFQVYGTLGLLGHVTAMFVGLVLTISTIVVQIAATRFTPLITTMFFKNKTVLFAGSFLTVTNLYLMWVNFSSNSAFLSRFGILTALSMLTVALFLLGPYVTYILNFLEPKKIIIRMLVTSLSGTSGENDAEAMALNQEKLVDAIEKLSDLGLSALAAKDVNMASDVINVLTKICIAYGKVKAQQPDQWFEFHGVLQRNLDFIGLSDMALAKLTKRKSWIEYKVLRQINVLYTSAFKNGKHLCHLATLQIRKIGEDAIVRQDRHALDLVVKHLNTSLRFTINNVHIRQCFNTLHQYGQLIQFLLGQTAHGQHKMEVIIFETIGYLKYYLQVCLQRKLDFVAEVISYDIASIVSRAYASSHPSHEQLLENALSILDIGRSRGIRCAMVKLACAYLHREGVDSRHVQRIKIALEPDSTQSLQAVWNELASTTKRDFWEVSDRGTNMNYLPPTHRQELIIFFGLFRDKVFESPEVVDRGRVSPSDLDHHKIEQTLMASLSSQHSAPSQPQSPRSEGPPTAELPPEVEAAIPEQIHSEETLKATRFRSHLRPALVMTAVLAAFLFATVMLGDVMVGHRFTARFETTSMSALDQASSASAFLFSAVEVMGILLTLVVTVSIVIVHITAARFTPLITWLFFHDKTVFSMLALLAANNVFVFWLDYSVNPEHIPSWGIFIALLVVTISLFLLMPYTSYILEFFNPGHIIARVLHNLLETASPRANDSQVQIAKRQTAILEKLDDLVHLSLKAAQWRDSTMVSYITGAFSTFVTDYWKIKDGLERFDPWFTTPESFRSNMAFVFMTDAERDNLNHSGTWLEWKVLYSYQVMMMELLEHYSGQVFMVSNATLNVGKVAVHRRSIENLNLVIKFFNTYIRHAMNKKDVRAAFNILNNYRQLAEFTLIESRYARSSDQKKMQQTVVQMAEYFRYYSIIFLERGLYFLCEVIAHDVGMITQKAYELDLDCHQSILDIFLTVDDVAESQGDEMVLRGIRRAQVKLATLYLQNGAEGFARQIQEDMVDEPQDRLEGILFEMTYVDTSEFWEVTDRGNNLDFLTPERKAMLPVFLSLFPIYQNGDDESEDLDTLDVAEQMLAPPMPAFPTPQIQDDSSITRQRSSLKQVLSRDVSTMSKRGPSSKSTVNLLSLQKSSASVSDLSAAELASEREALGRELSASDKRHATIKALEERTSGKAAGVSNYALPVETTGSNVAGTGISTERMQAQKELFAAKRDRSTTRGDHEAESDSESAASSLYGDAAKVDQESLIIDDDSDIEDETDRLLAGVNEIDEDEDASNRGISRRFFFRIFAFQLAFPLVAFLIYMFCLIIDANGAGNTSSDTILKSLFPSEFEFGDIALTGLPEVVALHVRIILLVSTIAVQIAAFRFTPLITRLFFHDRVIFWTLSGFVLTTAAALWVKYFVGDPYPSVAVVAVLLLTISCFIILIPFFAYVLNFLQPTLIINHLSSQGLTASVTDSGDKKDSKKNKNMTPEMEMAIIDQSRKEVMMTVDQLSDLGLKALSWRDRIIASKVCHAFRRFCISYSTSKHRHSEDWFKVVECNLKSGDFVNLSPESEKALEDGQVWLEWKVLRQYLSFFSVALTEGKELCYLVSINTRKIGEDATRRGDMATLDLAVKFFNTYLRFAINGRDMRVLYTIIHQYTLLSQSLIQQVTQNLQDKKHQSLAEEIKDRVVRTALFFVYYSNICLERELGFISQVFAYDLGTVVHTAFLLNFDAHSELLDLFLTIDDHASTKGDIPMLQAIRRAQVQLATIYLKHGDVDSAKEVYSDMEDEDVDFLQQLYTDLYNCDQREFWEINERGTNLDYIPPERRPYLEMFFRKFFPAVQLKEGKRIERSQSILPASSVALNMAGVSELVTPELGEGQSKGSSEEGDKNTRPLLWLSKLAPALVVPVTLMALLAFALIIEVIFGNTSFGDFFSSFVQLTQEEPVAFNALLSVPMVIATLLALVISVSTVVVQIAATRFTPLITALFFKDRVLIAILGFFVCTEVLVVTSAHTLDKRHHPSTLLFVVLMFTTASVVLLFPFFSYLLLFLDPNNIIKRIRKSGTRTIDQIVEVARIASAAGENLDHVSHAPMTLIREGSSTFGGSRVIRRQSTIGLGLSGRRSSSVGVSRDQPTPKVDPLSKVFSSANLGLLKEEAKDAPKELSEKALSLIHGQNEVTDIIERLTDLGLKALQWKDNTVASNALNSLGDVVAHHSSVKDDLRAHARSWFNIQSEWAEYSPDFLSLSREAIKDLVRRETWVEFKAMKAFLLMYTEAMGSMKELCFLVGRNSQKIGASAAVRGDFQALKLVIRFFNTFLRFALNAKDVRTAYNILQDYRKLTVVVIEAAKATKSTETATRLCSQVKDAIGYFAYYGHQFHMRGFPFITTIVAHDIAELASVAVKLQPDNKPWPFATICANSFTTYVTKIINQDKVTVMTISGVRLAEVKLAIDYKRRSLLALHRQVQTHLSSMQPEVRDLIQRQVRAATENEFWEVNDRGSNINYLEPAERPVFEDIMSKIGDAMAAKQTEEERKAEELKAAKTVTSSQHGFSVAVVAPTPTSLSVPASESTTPVVTLATAAAGADPVTPVAGVAGSDNTAGSPSSTGQSPVVQTPPRPQLVAKPTATPPSAIPALTRKPEQASASPQPSVQSTPASKLEDREEYVDIDDISDGEAGDIRVDVGGDSRQPPPLFTPGSRASAGPPALPDGSRARTIRVVGDVPGQEGSRPSGTPPKLATPTQQTRQ